MSSSLYERDDHDRPSLGRMASKTVAWALLFGLTVIIGMAGVVPQLIGAVTQPMRSEVLEPVISKGDLVVSQPVDPESLKAGDIITFRPPGGAPSITRTVVALEPLEVALPEDTDVTSTATGEPALATIVTSGDTTTKEYRISPGQVIGKVLYSLPFAGGFSSETLGGANPLLLVLVGVLALSLVLYLRYRRSANDD
jgi:signal peptidase